MASETNVRFVLPYVMMIVGVNGGKDNDDWKVGPKRAEGNDVLICAPCFFRAARWRSHESVD